MGEFFIMIVTVSVVIGIFNFISYPGQNEKVSRAAMAVLLLYAAAVSIFSVASRLSELDFDASLDFPEAEFGDAEYESTAKDAFTEGIRSLLYEKYGVENENAEVVIEDFDFKKMRAGRIKITLSGVAAFLDCRGIEKYIEECNLGECEVEIRLG